ncbi:thioredoxin [Floccifex sp.]|uniref:thioredoxin n=1 Tax=Floccifex sp. TaxID=2815810 RepID=UPI003F0B6376
MKIVNTEEFNALMNENLVLVDFFATWCGPCKMLAPVLEKVQETLNDKVKIVKVDVDQSPDLAAQFGVMAVPTMILFKNGKQVDAFSGYMPAGNIISKIEAHY